uniref:Cellulose synthase-like protein D5 n=1 Tax=Ananas comosus var. bracteatus TaxID=296719 RepID=A0A6V7NEF4_ANACO|nr:unnamed protein product [Ananas comosus var. bracteatus]
MARRSSSPAASPVTITVSATDGGGGGGGSGGALRRSIGLASPIPRRSLNPNSPSMSPPNSSATPSTSPDPDRHASSGPEDPPPDRSYISGTIFTGGFNCVTRGHVVDRPSPPRPRGSAALPLCKMRGCDAPAFSNPPCECGFSICKECYEECVDGGGHCPGCKELYNALSDEDEEEIEEEEAAAALPLASMKDLRGVGGAGKLSMMCSMKIRNGGGGGSKGPSDFDHSRWLFETKGTYGYGNAVWPKDNGGHCGGGGAGAGFKGFEEPPNFGGKCRRPLTRKVGVSQAILSPYRLLIVIRLVALGFFLMWRMRHPNREAVWLWGLSIACETWFAFSWLLDQLPKLCPVNRAADLAVLRDRFESPSARNPKGRSDLPGVDVFVSTADPDKEPPSSPPTPFARIWVPFCRKHDIEPRNPDAYFGQKRDFLKNKVRLDFVRERRKVKREYDEFKVRINSLPESIRRRSDAYNAHEELRARQKQQQQQQQQIAGNFAASPSSEPIRVAKATWMSDGSHWPGTWLSPDADHSRADHAGIIQAMLAPPSSEPEIGAEADENNLINTSGVDIRLPMLVYVSREKRPGYDHNKKAGAMNALVRTSAIMSNGPFILNLDCDHYIYNSLALREGMCFMLDRGGDRICYVQFPQRFEGIDPNDRYANHNLVFFDVTMRAMDGLQGPMYVGTGCVFRRTALYGFSPPRATEHRGWFGRKKIKLFSRKPTMGKKSDRVDEIVLPQIGDIESEDGDVESSAALLPKRFGSSAILLASIPVAEYQGRLLQDLPGVRHGRPAGTLAVPREPLDAATVAEAISVISCFYEDKTEWGRRVGWIYGSVTEDVVTGYRMHNRGWRSVYCVTKRDAFRGTAPINLTDRLHQVLRWATGSVEIFFSRNNALFASRRMKFLQRVAYFNVGMYPFTSIFLLVYCVLPAVSLFSGQFIVQSLSITFLIFLLAITVTLCLLALLEIKWSGITLHEWWRNEQFWVIGGTSAHPAAVLQGLLKVIAGVDISFTLTSKPAADENDDAFAELYVVKWSFLMVPPITIVMINAIAITVAVARTMYSEFPQWSKLLGGVFFSFWVLCHLYPFAKGLMGRRGKVPTIVFVWSGLISIVISLLWVYISPPAGVRKDYMNFQFP